MKRTRPSVLQLAAAAGLLLWPAPARASSHMDAPLITLDDAANTTDVYAFVSQRFGRKYLTTALAVYPHEEPGIGPNKYNFDDDVLYEIRVADRQRPREGPHDVRVSLQVRHDVQKPQHDSAVVPRRDRQRRRRVAESHSALYRRQGRRAQRPGHAVSDAASFPRTTRGTPRRNTTATTTVSSRPGTAWQTRAISTRYTSQSLANLEGGYMAFAGQRDDGFYADVQAIFDLLKLRPAGQGR